MLTFAIILTCINIIIWIYFFCFFKKNLTAEKLLHELHKEVSEMEKEIIYAADRSITLIDARRKGLQNLLEEAKRYTDLANAELDKKARSQNIMNALQSVNQPKKKYSQLPQQVVQQSLFSEETDGFFPSLENDTSDEVVISDKASSMLKTNETNNIPVISKIPEPIKIEKDPKTRVLELAAEGISSDLIATKLEMSITEVQLIIDMYGI